MYAYYVCRCSNDKTSEANLIDDNSEVLTAQNFRSMLGKEWT